MNNLKNINFKFYEDDTFNLIHAHNLGTRGTSSSGSFKCFYLQQLI